MSPLRPWLRLVRLPNTLTAVADVLAGAAVAGVALGSTRVLVAACGSAMIYAGAIAFNDWVDRASDRTTHPDRPLPSGAVSARGALALAVVLFVAGSATGLGSGLVHVGITAALVAAAVSYDLVSSRAAGPLLMGACRGLNVLRGLSLAGLDGVGPGLVSLLVAAAFLLVLLITAISMRERTPGPAVRVLGALLLLPCLAPAAAALLTDAGPLAVAGAAGGGLLLCAWVAGPVLVTPADPEKTVFRGVFGLIPFNALYGLAASGPLAGLGILALLPVSRFLARQVGQRGS